MIDEKPAVYDDEMDDWEPGDFEGCFEYQEPGDDLEWEEKLLAQLLREADEEYALEQEEWLREAEAFENVEAQLRDDRIDVGGGEIRTPPRRLSGDKAVSAISESMRPQAPSVPLGGLPPNFPGASPISALAIRPRSGRIRPGGIRTGDLRSSSGEV